MFIPVRFYYIKFFIYEILIYFNIAYRKIPAATERFNELD